MWTRPSGLDQSKGLEEPGVDRILRKEEVQRWSPGGTERHPRNREDGCGTSRCQQPQELPAAQTAFLAIALSPPSTLGRIRNNKRPRRGGKPSP